MSNTQDIMINLGDEALDHASTHEALAVCGGGYCGFPCMISDEPLDPAPAQKALVCACSYCGVSDEALDLAPAQQANACSCGLPVCYVQQTPAG